MEDCIFCKIIKGEIPSYKIYEDKEFLAFLDVFPKGEGHTLVIPKKHVESVWDYENIGKYFEVVGKVARNHRRVSGKKIVRSNICGWDVPHAHVHVLPGQKDTLSGKQSDEKMKAILKKFKVPNFK